MEVSWYPDAGIKQVKSDQKRALEAIFGDVIAGVWRAEVDALRALPPESKEYKSQKTKLPVFTPCGVFKERKDDKCVAYTGVVFIDLDLNGFGKGYANIAGALQDPELNEDAFALFDALKSDGYAWFVCRSPGGGFRIFVRTDATLERHADVYAQVVEWFSYNYDIPVGKSRTARFSIDASCKNVSRACFVSYDPTAWLNKTAQIFAFDEEWVNSTSAEQNGFNGLTNAEFEAFVVYIETSKIDLTAGYDKWYRLAFALIASFEPDAARDYFHRLSRFNAEYEPQACEAKFTNCLNSDAKAAPDRKRAGVGSLVRICQEYGFRVRIKSETSAEQTFDFEAQRKALRAVKLGLNIDEALLSICAAPHSPEFRQAVEAYYREHEWIFGAFKIKPKKDGDADQEETLVLKSSPFAVALKYAQKALKLQQTPQRGFEVIWNGEYEVVTPAIINGVEARLCGYGVNNPKTEKTLINQEIAMQKDPLKDFFNEAKERPNLEIVFDEFYSLIAPRFDREKMPDETIRRGLYVWGCFAVAQIFDKHRVNDIALGCVSQTQGTGKTLFCNALGYWADQLGMRSKPDFEGGRDGLRKLAQNWILHDDELVKRLKSENIVFKAALSEKTVSFVEKYQTQTTRLPRIASFTYCSNQIEFLSEESRRDFIIPFVESKEYDFEVLAHYLLDPDLTKRLWGYFFNEWQERRANVEAQYRILIGETVENNTSHQTITLEEEILALCFCLPPKGARAVKKEALKSGPKYYLALSRSDIQLTLNACLQETKGGAKINVDRKRVEQALSKLGFVYKTANFDDKTSIKGYHVQPVAWANMEPQLFEDNDPKPAQGGQKALAEGGEAPF